MLPVLGIATQSQVSQLGFVFPFGMNNKKELNQGMEHVFSCFPGYNSPNPPFTSPINITTLDKGLSCVVLIGTLDEGCYLKSKDINNLALKALPGLAKTRHGDVRQYAGEGVKISFDYSPEATYEFKTIYELPSHLKHTPNKNGVIGLRELIKHAVVLYKGKVYMLNKAQFDSLPQNLVALNPQKIILNQPLTLVPMSDNHYERMQKSGEAPSIYAIRRCRKCLVEESLLKKLFNCKRCIDEQKEVVATYCGAGCQKEDWDERHKLEHRKGFGIENPAILKAFES